MFPYQQIFLLLQALIADKFDPDKVDSLLRTRKGPPRWLTPLIADRAGRELIYTLSARYKNCQLLKYAMQRILKAGHDDEVGSVGSRLAGYFEVFHNLMVKRLEDMLTADDARMQILSQELLVSKPPPPHPPLQPPPKHPHPSPVSLLASAQRKLGLARSLYHNHTWLILSLSKYFDSNLHMQ